MNSGNSSDDTSNLDDFANLKDILPSKDKSKEIPAEYAITSIFLVPGVITQYFQDQVLFKPDLSDEVFNVEYSQMRHPPKIDIDCKHEVGHNVEVYVLDAKVNLHGWAKCTITSIVKTTYVVTLDQRNSLVVTQKDKIRQVTTGAALNSKYLYTFYIPVPEELQIFASNIEVHDTFCNAIGNPQITYDFGKNVLVISSSNADCEGIANMLLAIHFTNLTQRMLLTESINELSVKFERMKTEDLLEQFQVNPDLLKYVIGQKGKNIRKAESIPGVTFITVLKDTNTVKIYAENAAAIDKACVYLKLERDTIEIPRQFISKVIGKNGRKVQEIADESQLRHIVITRSENPTSEVVELELIGTSASIAYAKCLLKYHLEHLRHIQKLVKDNRDANQQYSTVFGDQNAKSSSESPAEGVASCRLIRRVVSGRKYQDSKKLLTNVNEKKYLPPLLKFTGNQGLIFYNENLSRGRAGSSSGGRSNGGRRSRGRNGYQTMPSRVDNSEGKLVGNQVAKLFQQSFTNRGRARGRGRGRGFARAQIHDMNSLSSRESQNGSSPDENHDQAQKQPLVEAGDASTGPVEAGDASISRAKVGNASTSRVEAGDASTNGEEVELERQRKQGAIKRVPRNPPQQKNKPGGTSGTSNQAAPEDQKSWFGKRWRNRKTSTADLRTWEYENYNKVYYAKNGAKKPKNAKGDNPAPEEDLNDF